MLNYTRPSVLSVQIGVRGKSKISSPARKMEEAGRGRCIDSQRNTLDGSNARRFQSRSSFSDELRTGNDERQSIIQVTGHANEKSRNDYDDYIYISEWAPKATTSNSFLRRISSVVFFNQYGTDPAARAIWKPSRNAIAFMRFPILFLCRMVSHTKIQFGFECDKNTGRQIIIIVTISFKKKSVFKLDVFRPHEN